MDEIECVVIGAGVIGLAIGRALALAGREVLIVEKENCIGSGVSSRNSEVIHAGIYYPTGTLKAEFCVRGRDRLYAYCEDRHIEHRRCGKLIVATQEAQIADLEKLAVKAEQNGVHDMRFLTRDEARRLEPDLACEAALLSPSTGIIDTHGLMVSLLGDAEAAGAVIAYKTAISGFHPETDGLELLIGAETAPSLKAHLVVNAAGLDAAALTGRHTHFYAKGSYFGLGGKSPFSRLIYPVPEPGGLGVHLTLDLGGQARFGPDVEWIETPNFDVDPKRAEKFYAAVRAYWPALGDGALLPAYAGVRPKLSGPGEPAADFLIEGPDLPDARGLINLLGIESPGLTSCLAIADHVAALAGEHLNG